MSATPATLVWNRTVFSLVSGVPGWRHYHHSGLANLPLWELTPGHLHFYCRFRDQGFLCRCVFLCVLIVDRVSLLYLFCFVALVFLCCQYQCKWLPGKTRLRNDLLCVERDVKLYSLTHSLASESGTRQIRSKLCMTNVPDIGARKRELIYSVSLWSVCHGYKCKPRR